MKNRRCFDIMKINTPISCDFHWTAMTSWSLVRLMIDYCSVRNLQSVDCVMSGYVFQLVAVLLMTCVFDNGNFISWIWVLIIILPLSRVWNKKACCDDTTYLKSSVRHKIKMIVNSFHEAREFWEAIRPPSSSFKQTKLFIYHTTFGSISSSCRSVDVCHYLKIVVSYILRALTKSNQLFTKDVHC